MANLFNLIGKGLDVLTDFIPGANLVQEAVEAVIPGADEFFAGELGEAGEAAELMHLTGGGSNVSGNLPALPMSTAVATTEMIEDQGPGGLPIPWFKGPGGKLQLPGSDPRIPQFLKQFALDDAYLKIYYRAPRGYVVLRDSEGRPYAVSKIVAQRLGLWKPAARPPISATDWKHFKRNKQIERRLMKIAGPAIRRRRRKTTTSKSKK